MSIENTLTFILTLANRDDLARINAAYRERVRTLGHITGFNLTSGQKVRVVNISPKYLEGQQGIIQSVKQTRAVVTFDPPLSEGRFYGTRSLTIPLSCLEAAS